MKRYGLGADLVEIARFADWHHKSFAQLSHIFTPHEIAYALASPIKTAERFAVRFAAREACFKALHDLLPDIQIPLLTVLRNVHVTHAPNGAPQLIINWDGLNIFADTTTLHKIDYTHITVQLSLTHTRDIAGATVLLISAVG